MFLLGGVYSAFMAGVSVVNGKGKKKGETERNVDRGRKDREILMC